MIVLDTAGVFAALNPEDRWHDACRTFLDTLAEPAILSPFELGELDYLLVRDFGRRAELTVLDDIAAGAYELARFDASDVERAAQVVRRYHDQRIGFADASIVVLAERYETNRVLTLDLRHFRALRVKGKKFVVLPADA